jgi:hypothetical protein
MAFMNRRQRAAAEAAAESTSRRPWSNALLLSGVVVGLLGVSLLAGQAAATNADEPAGRDTAADRPAPRAVVAGGPRDREAEPAVEPSERVETPPSKPAPVKPTGRDKGRSRSTPHVPTQTEKDNSLYFNPPTSLAVNPNAFPLTFRPDVMFRVYRQQAMPDASPSPGAVAMRIRPVPGESRQALWMEQAFVIGDKATGSLQISDQRLDSIEWHLWMAPQNYGSEVGDKAGWYILHAANKITLGSPNPSCESSTSNPYCGELSILNADWKVPAAQLPGGTPVYVIQFDLSSFNYVLSSSNSYDILIVAGVAPTADPGIEINTLTADTIEPRQPSDHWFTWSAYAHQPETGFNAMEFPSYWPYRLAGMGESCSYPVAAVYTTGAP